jgi:hypothetical protein
VVGRKVASCAGGESGRSADDLGAATLAVARHPSHLEGLRLAA